MNYIISEEKIKELGLNRYDFKAVVFALTEDDVCTSLEQNPYINRVPVEGFLNEIVVDIAEYYYKDDCSYECEKLDEYIISSAKKMGIYDENI